MRRAIVVSLAALLVVAGAERSAAVDHFADSTVTVPIQGPTVVGFYTPTSQAEFDADEPGLTEAIAHLRFALEDLDKCLAALKPSVRLEFASSIILQTGGRTEIITLPPDSVGILLARLDRPHLIVYAAPGPSSLTWLAPEAAADYFGVPGCKPRF